MKSKSLLIVMAVCVTLILWVLATAVTAQGEPPPPYAGLKNPFPWSDTSAQEAGEKLYQQSCLGCHGANGGSIAKADFSIADYPQSLEERPDFYFWVLSEGKLNKGMPSYKSSLSEEQRWQVLTYLWSLGAGAPQEVTPSSAKSSAKGENTTLLLAVPEQAQSGQSLTMTATLRHNQGKPLGNTTVKFFIRVDFFTTGLMEIGDAITNDKGVAVFEYTPRQMGDIQVIARYEGDGLNPLEAAATVSLEGSAEPFYEAETGIQLPAPGEEVLIGPESAVGLKEGAAPMTAFRLPSGILSWLLLLVATVILIWFTYFRVMNQVFHIPIGREITDTDTRRVPLVGMIIAVALGILLVLLLVTGPYSHLQLFR